MTVVRASELSAHWRKSSRSQNGAHNCVEVAGLMDGTAVRDSKDPDGPALVLGRAQWAGFVADLKGGHFDR